MPYTATLASVLRGGGRTEIEVNLTYSYDAQQDTYANLPDLRVGHWWPNESVPLQDILDELPNVATRTRLIRNSIRASEIAEAVEAAKRAVITARFRQLYLSRLASYKNAIETFMTNQGFTEEQKTIGRSIMAELLDGEDRVL